MGWCTAEKVCAISPLAGILLRENGIDRGKVARNTTIFRTLGCTFRPRRNLCW
jgi:hypothetical protein